MRNEKWRWVQRYICGLGSLVFPGNGSFYNYEYPLYIFFKKWGGGAESNY